ncbi:unnamed protein product [Alopecurus aequalis]
MGSNMSNPIAFLDAGRRLQDVATQEQALAARLSSSGNAFPGSGYRPANRKTWMAGLGSQNVRLHQVLWPGTHNSATNGIGDVLVTRHFSECQTLSVYEQLVMGCRVLDVRVENDRRICHGGILGYSVGVVLDDVKRFLGETSSEIVILEVRTEFNQQDPPGFDRFLIEQLGDHLIRQDDRVFNKTIAELLPKRVICVSKPRQSPAPNPGGLLWSAGYLRDNWSNTDLPQTKFDSNLDFLGQNPPLSQRKYFYRVENTATAQGDNLSSLTVDSVTRRMHRFARLFISEAHRRGDKLQVFSTDFIDRDFVDACVGATKGRVDANRGV